MDEELRRVGKRLGLRLGKIVDRLLLKSLAQDFVEIFKELRAYLSGRRYRDDQPVNWDLDVREAYRNEDRALLLRREDGSTQFIGQALLVDAADFPDQQEIKIRWDEVPRKTIGAGCVEALDFYRKQADERGKELFDGELAGVSGWDPVHGIMTFRECKYFDYLQTNLALDFRDSLAGTLRERVSAGGRLEKLSESRLANPSGVNGLIFTNDGYMVLQERLPKVLIRANELCSGFSGTLNGTDIDHALESGVATLARVDMCREMEEEIGIRSKRVRSSLFLGVAREMLRGGMTEFFYAVEVNLGHKEVLDLVPKDKEGLVKVVHIGAFAACRPEVPDHYLSVEGFWSIISKVRKVGNGIISVPLLTNLALWYRTFYPPILSMNE
jgi:hypothetical protein